MSGPPTLLRRVQFTSFKCLADVQIPLPSRLTLIVGKNASGKSSVLDGIARATEMFVRGVREEDTPMGRFLGRFESPKLHTRNRIEPMRIRLDYGDGLDVTVVRDGPRRILESCNAPVLDRPNRPATAYPDPWVQAFDERITQHQLGPAVQLRLSARVASRPSPAAGTGTPRIEHDGAGLATMLAWLAGNQPKTKKAIEDALATVVPGTGMITTPSADVPRVRDEEVRIGDDVMMHARRETIPGHTFCLDMPGAEAVPADMLSDGTVLTLALLTVLYGPSCPRIVLIDDIDAELHPEAQASLIVALRKILELKPDVQIVATTHSPYLLDSFEPSDVVVLDADPKTGHTSAKLLSSHPRAETSKGILRTGELWSAVGEDWASEGTRAEGK